MNEHDFLAERFEENRQHLTALAYRMLGSAGEADDAVQEAWLRVSGAGAEGVENFGGWLTRIVGRVCLDMLRSRKSRREDPLADLLPEQIPDQEEASNPEHEAILADSVGIALLVVLETLAPAERIAFVLHDLFAVPFEEIATVVGRSPAAARQLASRARRRVQGAAPGNAPSCQRTVVDAFLAASREGNFEALLSMLHPDVVVRSDAAAVLAGSVREARGPREVAAVFAGRAKVARTALINGAAGLVWAPGGQTRVVFAFTFMEGKVTEVEILADPERIRGLEIQVLGD